MSLKVVGAGLGRTGTQSMKLALERLGMGPCYHMMEIFGNLEHISLWTAAARGGKRDWDTLFADYQSTVDWPGCAFWRELAARYPDSKVLLTYRDSEAWYDSFHNTIYRAMIREVPPEPVWVGEHLRMTQELILEQAFGGRADDRAHVIRCYEKHNESVRSEIPADRLILHEVGAGWEPLCTGLGLPIPDEAYPRTNSTKDFQDRLAILDN